MISYDIICISESFLNSDYATDDPRLCIQGYVMARSDDPSNTKRGCVCIYYKEHMPFVRRTDIAFLDECIVAEIKLKKKIVCYLCLSFSKPNGR